MLDRQIVYFAERHIIVNALKRCKAQTAFLPLFRSEKVIVNVSVYLTAEGIQKL